ncbi:hypothetical protein PHMEG_0007639 [Phytophthora megakarya]|uniref:Uncharacterized protein n=1 Tax=Phytophthora megakarya TaxID=4795 RepID=A0A225WMC8_9STRA|nr:hypothetical protein PHMEG_0007639 [Phytophthora megakarya]
MLEQCLKSHKAEFCVAFGCYPSVKVQSLRIKIFHHIPPIKRLARGYAQMQQTVREAHMGDLENFGMSSPATSRQCTSRRALLSI